MLGSKNDIEDTHAEYIRIPMDTHAEHPLNRKQNQLS